MEKIIIDNRTDIDMRVMLNYIDVMIYIEIPNYNVVRHFIRDGKTYIVKRTQNTHSTRFLITREME